MLSQVGAQTYMNTSLTNTAVTALTVPTHGGLLLYNIIGFNGDASSISFVQFFDALLANVTLGVTVPKFVLPLGIRIVSAIDMTCPQEYRTGVVIACTSTATGAAAPSTNATLSIDYVAS